MNEYKFIGKSMDTANKIARNKHILFFVPNTKFGRKIKKAVKQLNEKIIMAR